jgi:hypothetical protein
VATVTSPAASGVSTARGPSAQQERSQAASEWFEDQPKSDSDVEAVFDEPFPPVGEDCVRVFAVALVQGGDGRADAWGAAHDLDVVEGVSAVGAGEVAVVAAWTLTAAVFSQDREGAWGA